MDIFSTKGQQTVKDEEEAALIWERNFPAYKYAITPKDKPAVIDAVIVRDNSLKYCVETKCRYDMDLDIFAQRNYEWLVTADKLQRAAQVSAYLGIPLLGFLYLSTEKCLFAEQLTDAYGNFIVPIRKEETQTQKTVNGGKIVRMNAFIDMKNAKILF